MEGPDLSIYRRRDLRQVEAADVGEGCYAKERQVSAFALIELGGVRLMVVADVGDGESATRNSRNHLTIVNCEHDPAAADGDLGSHWLPSSHRDVNRRPSVAAVADPVVAILAVDVGDAAGHDETAIHVGPRGVQHVLVKDGTGVDWRPAVLVRDVVTLPNAVD